jgi:hypothetical protein
MRPFKSKQIVKNVGRKILIAYEGMGAEKGYFNAIRQYLRLQATRVILAPHTGTDPYTIVKQASNQFEGRTDKRRSLDRRRFCLGCI